MWAITTAAWRLRLPEGLLVDSAVLTESLRSAPIDVVDRGRPTGLVLVSAEAVRLLHWQAGRVEQPTVAV